ncbi:hypothetical protein DTO282E5_5152 [Paecilomyces variotii]|nr:hypothetical protein DTO282E5_5152 [Paecilomyces variotii]
MDEGTRKDTSTQDRSVGNLGLLEAWETRKQVAYWILNEGSGTSVGLLCSAYQSPDASAVSRKSIVAQL